MDHNSDRLDELLESWDKVRVGHPRLNQRVWARIANEESDSSAFVLPGFFRLVHSILSRPAYASAFVVGCVLVGLLLAEVRVAKEQAKRGTQLAESYKQVIDPLLKDTYRLK